ncbi:vacuolar protein sorting-associated protein 13D-like [Papilio machaon]|uniref:vacuolar protein sorting-associated protein 13D-like n=1 Tax=Papilio machaon TaxID=76193 RepID=UPI001E664471|nr:vacuolar protein sorting-associated protein 13D-like [Papilio machaon]
MGQPGDLVGAASPLVHAGGGGAAGAALHAAAELMPAPARRYNAYYFRHLVVALRPVAVRLEERLILVLWAWAEQWGGDAQAAEQPDEVEYETRRVLTELTALHATRYYFALIKLIPGQIRLSMYTASKLEPALGALKQRLGLTLVRFEHAAVELEPFVRTHVFDTAACLARHALQHFKDELKWQAAKILGSVDFLGNPLGFMADVSEGVSGLLLEGNVGALVKNVTHGISNSAAKVTESLGDGLERVVGDEAHEETRRRIRSAAAGAHLAAGLRGLGLGLLGGMTSLVKHSYEGATQEGLGGFVSGVGKGLVGTVTKPVIGVLDLAAAAAAAVRESSARAGRAAPARTREPRPAPHTAALTRYCPAAARGAQLLHALAPPASPALVHPERFLAYRPVRGAPHDIRALLTDTHLRIFTCKHDTPQIVMETHLSNLVSCTAVYAEGAHLVELCVRGAGAGAGAGAGEAVRRPRVQCDSGELATWLARSAAHARQLHRDLAHTLLPHPDLG